MLPLHHSPLGPCAPDTLRVWQQAHHWYGPSKHPRLREQFLLALELKSKVKEQSWVLTRLLDLSRHCVLRRHKV